MKEWNDLTFDKKISVLVKLAVEHGVVLSEDQFDGKAELPKPTQDLIRSLYKGKEGSES